MDRVDEILLYIQKTNPEMTREKLVEELSKSEYAAKSLIFGAMNVKKLKCWVFYTINNVSAKTFKPFFFCDF